jgi:integrase
MRRQYKAGSPCRNRRPAADFAHCASAEFGHFRGHFTGLLRTYSRLRDLAGLPRDLVLYLARHECGTKICREKGIEYARRLLGHTNISTTQRYMHLDEHELADAQDLVE